MSAPENAGELRPRIRGAHIHDPDRLDAYLRRFCQVEARGLTQFDAAPELFLRREQEMLVERISGMVSSTHLPPPVMIESTAVLALVTHMLCWT